MEDTRLEVFKPGRYFVGDLCLVMVDELWQHIAKRLHPMDAGVTTLELPHDIKVCVADTEHGDGAYNDQDGHRYLVESGTIGVVDIYTVDTIDVKWGRVVDFKEPFEVTYDKGVIRIGHLAIDTRVPF